jgi:septal ring factor EnvC (AmiA/AmiB activator)
MTKQIETKDWTTKFFEKNAWAIIIFVASLIYFLGGFFPSNDAKIEAMSDDISRIEQAILNISQNQEKIIILQEKQNTTDANITEIKQDIREIKNALNIL